MRPNGCSRGPSEEELPQHLYDVEPYMCTSFSLSRNEQCTRSDALFCDVSKTPEPRGVARILFREVGVYVYTRAYWYVCMCTQLNHLVRYTPKAGVPDHYMRGLL